MKASSSVSLHIALGVLVLALGFVAAPRAIASQPADSQPVSSQAADSQPATMPPADAPLAGSQPAASQTNAPQSNPTPPSAATTTDGTGRIVLYRISALFGYGMRADVNLDGKKVGRTVPGTQFHVDTTPGVHHVEVPNEMHSGERGLDINVASGQTAYVRFWIGGSGFGGRTNMESVDPAKGETDTAKMKSVSY